VTGPKERCVYGNDLVEPDGKVEAAGMRRAGASGEIWELWPELKRLMQFDLKIDIGVSSNGLGE